MIKVEVIRNEKEGFTSLVFETRNVSPEGLDKFDELYSALLGSRLKHGGYTDSNRFKIDVKDED